MMSVVTLSPGIAARRRSTHSRYSSREYLRSILLRISVEPDCIGRWTCSQTVGTSAMAAITRSEKSLGCGLVKRTRRTPGTVPTARSRSAKSWVPSVYEFTVWPRSTTSVIPASTMSRVSRTTSSSRRLRSGPRV